MNFICRSEMLAVAVFHLLLLLILVLVLVLVLVMQYFARCPARGRLAISVERLSSRSRSRRTRRR